MRLAETTVNRPAERIHLFAELPELEQPPDDAAKSFLQALSVPLLRLDVGTWRPDLSGEDARGHLGFLVLDGLLTREATIAGSTWTELLGEGDVLRPWTEIDSEVVSIPAESHWQVVMPTRLAVLDRRFALRTAHWPEITSAIVDRLVQRARWLAFHLAVCQIVGVEVKVLIVLWHLADRWGHVTPEGVTVPLPLSHGLLASIVGSRRPTVSTAVTTLRERGLVERTDSGWLLHGDPPAELEELRAQIAARKTTIKRSGR